MQRFQKKQMENKIKIEQRSLIVILALLVLIASASIYEHKEQARREACVQMKNELIQGTFGSAISGIQAHSFFAYDFTQSLPLYGKNENEPRPLASLTKLMTVRLALEHGSPTDFYTVRNHDLDSDAFAGFAIGDSYRIEDLIRAALIGSVNDAAMMLARSTGATDSAFVDSMNFESAHLGFSSLHFGNPTGLDPIWIGGASPQHLVTAAYSDHLPPPSNMLTNGLRKTRLPEIA